MFKYFADLGHTARFRLILALMACLFVSKASFASAPQVVKSNLWDSNKYISVDEITTDMQAYCLTVYEGTKVEKFELKIVSIAKDSGVGTFPFDKSLKNENDLLEWTQKSLNRAKTTGKNKTISATELL